MTSQPPNRLKTASSKAHTCLARTWTSKATRQGQPSRIRTPTSFLSSRHLFPCHSYMRKKSVSDPGTYQLESTLQPPILLYQRPAVGEERFSQKTLAFFRRNWINPNNPNHQPESLVVTYRISPYQNWRDHQGKLHTGFCTCKGFSVRKSCRHLTKARQLLTQSSQNRTLSV